MSVSLTPDQSQALRAFETNGAIRLANAERIQKGGAKYVSENLEGVKKLVQDMQAANEAMQAYVNAGNEFKGVCKLPRFEKLPKFLPKEVPALEVAARINAILTEQTAVLQEAGVLPKPEEPKVEEPKVEEPKVEEPKVEVKPTRFARLKQAVKAHTPSTRKLVVGGSVLAAVAGLGAAAYVFRGDLPAVVTTARGVAGRVYAAIPTREQVSSFVKSDKFVGLAGVAAIAAAVTSAPFGVVLAVRSAPKVARVAKTVASKTVQAAKAATSKTAQVARNVGARAVNTAKAASGAVRSRFVRI